MRIETLVGAPGETPETLRETFETISEAASPWDLVNIAVGMRVYKGSPVSEWLVKQRPHAGQQDFLCPVSLPEGTTLGLAELKRLTKMECFRRPNFFMYDEDEDTSQLQLLLGTKAMRLLAPHQPLWRIFVLLRKVQGFLGIRALQRHRYQRSPPVSPPPTQQRGWMHTA